MSKKNLKPLIADVTSCMIELNYSDNSIRHYTDVWRRYLKNTDFSVLDKEDIISFLEKVYDICEGSKKLTRYQRTALRAMNVLIYYAEYQKIYIRFPLANPIMKETPFDFIVKDYIDFLKKSEYTLSTLHTHERVVNHFIKFLSESDICEINQITPQHITNFILEITGRRGKVSYELNVLRVFFRFLVHKELHSDDLSLFIPASNKLKWREHLPTIWSDDDIKKILNCIDTGNPVGKRDYAIILLAIRLGLRGSDIKNLKFEDINWDNNTISIIQTKTKEPLALPLIEEVGSAIINYLKSSRPISQQPYIFLSLKAPYNPLSKDNHLHQILNKYIKKTDIVINSDKSHGMHSVRHTLASKLLKQGTELPVISGILGHKNVQTTNEYLRIDIEQLRGCTLSVLEGHHEK